MDVYVMFGDKMQHYFIYFDAHIFPNLLPSGWLPYPLACFHVFSSTSLLQHYFSLKINSLVLAFLIWNILFIMYDFFIHTCFVLNVKIFFYYSFFTSPCVLPWNYKIISTIMRQGFYKPINSWKYTKMNWLKRFCSQL